MKKENREAGIKLEIISKQLAKVTTRLSLKPRWISKGTTELLWGREQIKPCEHSFTLTLHSSIPHTNLPSLLLYADCVKAPSSDTSLAFLFNTSRNLSISVKEARRREAVLTAHAPKHSWVNKLSHVKSLNRAFCLVGVCSGIAQCLLKEGKKINAVWN